MSLSPEILRSRIDGVMIRDRHRLGRQLDRALHADDTSAERAFAMLVQALERAERRREERACALPDVSYPAGLPVTARREEIAESVREHQVVVVAGETGSGKTTQIPKICLELGRGVDGMIGHTQPRRIAARTVAERIAEELSVPLGGPVGYAVRFNDQVSEETLVKVMTDGILLAEIRRDRMLTAYDTIIVDEAHERSLNIDFLLGYLSQLLPRRRDLKVIITSATIDTARFAQHFSAPVVEVSGRTYPVEIRYRPPGTDGDDGDLNQAICDAVSELVAEQPGDVLVFLPGERDIRDAAEALRAVGPPELEVLPLYARLSAAEQHRVFLPHRRRRVVLATNVAETSLTVPGIGSVVDTGLARISRFSRRTKVQRLPIEPISQASADQRAGRCGRVAPGICIRLYSEDDYAARLEFTEPEILRTNLASVILQMAAIGLGEVASFPFLDPPDQRAVTDGRALLEELSALERRGRHLQLTPIGRRLAELPLDPRLGRMVLEAAERDCLREVTVIAAAMSIQDPRERPADKATAAEEWHSRFRVPDSDFLAFVRLWDYLAELQTELSGNQFRKRCRSEFLNVQRIREWQDVAGQIRQYLRGAGLHANREPASSEVIHQALLSGLLSQIGMRDRLRGDYQGARNTRWQIGRSSSLARHQPPWAVAGALVETGLTWASTVARIEPVWAERAGAHLTRHKVSEPWWDPKRGEAMADERVTLFGLPLVTDRPVSLGRSDPGAARELFIDRALVERDWVVRVDALERNASRIEELERLEVRMRRRGLVVTDAALFAFYDAKIPSEVTNGRRFERWWKGAERLDPSLLDIPLDALVDPAAGPIDLSGFPDRLAAGSLEVDLVYCWDPGSANDGVTAVVPLVALNQVESATFEWLVPGLRAELIAALLRALPKALRRELVPAARVADELAAAVGPADGPLRDVLAAAVARRTGEAVTPTTWDLAALPPHLRMHVEVRGEDGTVVARGDDLETLRTELRERLRGALAASVPGLERHNMTSWEIGDLPPVVEPAGARGYPALVDEGDSVGIEVLESEEVQASSMWRGTRRLLLIAARSQRGHLERRLTNAAKLALVRVGMPAGDLVEDCFTAAADELIAEHGGPAFEASGFEALAASARRQLGERAARLVSAAGSALAAAQRVEAQLAALEGHDHSAATAAAVSDVRRQLARLIRPGFVSALGPQRLEHLPRYLAAASRRLERLPADGRRDAARLAVISRLQGRYERILAEVAAGRAEVSPRELSEVRWMLEELRVSLFAQDLGTASPVSETRIVRLLDRLG